MRPFSQLLFIFLAAFGVRAAIYFSFPDYGTIPPREMERVSRCWAEAGEFCNPYATPTGPTAHVAPVYPVILGSLYRIFGAYSPHAMLAQAILSWTLCALRCALLLPLAVALRLPRNIGMIAAILSIFFISAFHTELRGAWDAPLIALCMMGLVWFASGFSGASSFNLAAAPFRGLAIGLALLINPALLPVIAGYCLLAAYAYWPGLRRYAAWLLLVAAGTLVVLTPWALRNLRALGSPILFRSNFGLELALSFSVDGAASVLDPEGLRNDPAIDAGLSNQVAEMGEVAFNRQQKKEAWDRIRNDPQKAAHIVAAHIVYFWFPPASNRIFRLLLAGLTVAAFLGMAILWRQSVKAAILILAIWVTFPLIYYIAAWSSRYRYPMEWTMLLCAAAVLDFPWRYFQARVSGETR